MWNPIMKGCRLAHEPATGWGFKERGPVQLPEHIFRAYDIRGIVGEDLTEEIVRQIGLGYGTMMVSEGRRSIAVGHDVRESSPRFAAALAEGLQDAGMDVVLVGQVPTPLLYYSVTTQSLAVHRARAGNPSPRTSVRGAGPGASR